MLRAIASLTVTIALLCTANTAQSQTANFRANPESTRHGIKSLKLEKQGKVLDIDIMGEHRRMARLTVEFDTPEGTLLDLEHGKNKLRMTWSQQTGRFTLTEKKTTAFVARTVSIKSGKQMVTEGDASLIEKYENEVDLTFTVLDQALEETGLYEFFRKVPETEKGLEKLISNCPPSCGGPYLQPSAVAGSRSRCCEIATNDANVACSNSLCFGCCRILGCDAVCGIGDFACVCTVLGQACSEPIFECDDTWPPECT